MLDLEKAQRMSLTMQVEVKLKNALIVGSLRPGARLVTKEIADQLGTSITPVREALLRLVSCGALNATPAQAFLVPEMSLERYEEISQIRKNLESMAVEAAIPRLSRGQLASLREMYQRFHAAKLAGNVEEALHTNHLFRFQLYACAQMPTLLDLIEQLWVRIGPCFNFLYPQSPDYVKKHHDYDDLLAALEEGDTERSVQAIHYAIDDATYILKKQYFA